MIIPRIKMATLIALLVFFVNIVAKVIGSLLPLNPTMRGFSQACEGRPQPCWYGITPEVTTSKDAEHIAGKLGYITCFLNFEYSDSGEIITAIELFACEDIRLGDLLVQYLALPPDTANITVNSRDSLLDKVADFTVRKWRPSILVPIN